MTLVDLLVVTIAKSLGIWKANEAPITALKDADTEPDSKIAEILKGVSGVAQNLLGISDITSTFDQYIVQPIVNTFGDYIIDPVVSGFISAITSSQIQAWWHAIKSNVISASVNFLNGLTSSWRAQ